MMRFDWGKFGIDIRQVRGGKGFCPKCGPTRKNKRDRSLSVNLDNGTFNCFNSPCDFKGFAGDASILARPVKEYAKPMPKLQKVSDRVLKYFEGRGISNNTLLALKVTESLEWMPECGPGEKKLAICFNYFRDEELVNIKYRSADKKFKLEKDAELIFYNLNATNERKEIIIVEGEIDVLTAYECGLPNVVSVPNGASSGRAKLDYLNNCWHNFQHIDKIIIAVDDDGPGRALEEELIRRFGSERCYLFQYPTGYKDISEVYWGDGKKGLQPLGKDAVRNLIASAERPPLEGVDRVADMVQPVMKIYYDGFPETLKLNWELDDYIKWRLGELTIVTGTPNAGKSTWVNNVLEALARLHGWRTAMFSPEKNPLELLVTELAQIHVGLPFYKKDPLRKMNLEDVKRSLEFVNDNFLFLKVDDIDITIDGLIEKAEQCVERYGINCLVIDPWNYLEHKRPVYQTETEYISEALSKLATFCKRRKVHTFLIAHPKKMTRDPKTKQFDIPSLYDISGSAHFFNKADNGVVIYRNMAQGCTDVYVQKIRWFFTGKIGNVQQFFHLDAMRFRDQPAVQTYEDKLEERKNEFGDSKLFTPGGFNSFNNPDNKDDLPF